MENKIIIITGGASGIGLATSKKLSRDNKVIIADYKDVEEEFVKMFIFLNAIFQEKKIF